jgi:hypothetical protein
VSTEIAEAYIALHTKMPGVKQEITSALDGSDARSAIDSGGQGQGKRFSKAFGVAAVAGIAAVGIGAAVAGITKYLGESVVGAKEA